LAQFADSVLRAVRRNGVRNLIIDVRRNNGGNGSLNRSLIRAMIAFEKAGPGRRVYVIAGRNTFSAAQNFINDVERWTDATFAGEPSSSRPNFVGEDTELRLPYSGIVGSMSSRYFQDSHPLDDRQWIAPDIPVQLSSQDYFANRDPVLAAVLDAIRDEAAGRQGGRAARR
jgi:C-terminal processing protease CtpA/Prc